MNGHVHDFSYDPFGYHDAGGIWHEGPRCPECGYWRCDACAEIHDIRKTVEVRGPWIEKRSSR